MDQNVYFHSEAPGLLDDENETYLMTILLCHPAAPKRTSRRLSFRIFARAVAYWATAGLGSRSSASNSPKGYGHEGSLAGFAKWEYGSTDVWDVWRLGLVSSNEISNLIFKWDLWRKNSKPGPSDVY